MQCISNILCLINLSSVFHIFVVYKYPSVISHILPFVVEFDKDYEFILYVNKVKSLWFL